MPVVPETGTESQMITCPKNEMHARHVAKFSDYVAPDDLMVWLDRKINATG